MKKNPFPTIQSQIDYLKYSYLARIKFKKEVKKMKKVITINITSTSEEALQWAIDCIKEDLRVGMECRRHDTDDPNIYGEITDIQDFD